SGYGRYPYYPPPPYYRPPPYYPPPGYRPPPPGYRPPGYPPPSYSPSRPTPYPADGSRPGVPTTLPADAGGVSTIQRWQPDQSRMVANGGASALPSAATMEARGWSSGAAASSTRAVPGTGSANTWNKPTAVAPQPARNVSTPSPPRPVNNIPILPAQTPNPTRAAPSQGNAQPAPNHPVNRPSQSPSNTGQGSAFGGLGNGNAARDSSNRGAASRGN